MFRASAVGWSVKRALAVAALTAVLGPLSGRALAAQDRRPPDRDRQAEQRRREARPRVPHRGTVVRVLPPEHVRVVVRGVPYFFWGGAFYRTGPGGYVVVAAPAGAVLGALPFGYVSLRIGPRAYFYYGGVFYQPYARQYVVVAPPIGAAVPYVPADATVANINGVLYYFADGVYYRPEVRPDGSVTYIISRP